MKRLGMLLLALCLLCACASGEEAAEARRGLVQSLLTETYGYTAEEAQGFEILSEGQEGDITLSFWPKEHPSWRYTAQLSQTPDELLVNETSPFDRITTVYAYPQEKEAREGMRLARDEWLGAWEAQGRARMAEWLSAKGLQPIPEHASAGDGLHAFLKACFGHTYLWPAALWQWEAETLEALALPPAAEQPASGIVRFVNPLIDASEACTAVRFEREAPEELREAFSQECLAGWTLRCGAYYTASSAEQHGLAAFACGDRLLLVYFHRGSPDTPFLLHSMGEKALWKDRAFYITVQGLGFDIVYPVSATENEWFSIRLTYETPHCLLRAYSRADSATGESLEIILYADGQYRLAQRSAQGTRSAEWLENRGMTLLAYADLSAFPTTAEACRRQSLRIAPEGYGVVTGVRLRNRTSSRSHNLGEYHHGALVQVLETEPGNPWPWYRVRAGSAEGYMSSAYVLWEDNDHALVQDQLSYVLPVAEAKERIALKKGTGWFAGSRMRLEPGTRMHVMAERNGWLHVMLPTGELGWQMDVEGIDGYVRKEQVRLIDPTLLTPAADVR